MLNSFAQGRRVISLRLSGAMESLRQRKKFTSKASSKAEGLITAKIPKTADEKFAADAGVQIPGHGLSGTVLASTKVSLEDIPDGCVPLVPFSLFL